MVECIKVEECIDRGLYRIRSRNLTFGVYRKASRGFVGIREKFGDEYLFEEYHWDTGPPCGTVMPIRFLEPCPLEDLSAEGNLSEGNQALFNWLQRKGLEYEAIHPC